MNRILFISPHGDDAELWAGATMAKRIADGDEVVHVSLSCLDNGREHEAVLASKALGGCEVHVYGFTDTGFDGQRSSIRNLFRKLNDVHRPDVVFVPPLGDRHQDHAVVTEEARRMFRHSSILGYDIPYNEPLPGSPFYVPVDIDEMATKIRACHCYKSQIHQPYMAEDAILSLARVRGIEIRRQFAERFDVIRWIQD